MFPKRMFALAILFLAVLSSVATTAAEPLKCVNANKFMTFQHFKPFVLDTLTKTDSEVCGGMWKRDGTCCNEAETKAFGRDRINRMRKYIGEFNQQIHALGQKVLELTSTDIQLKGKSTQEVASHFEQVGLGFLKNFLDTNYSQRFNESTSKCWQHIGHLRVKSLCSMCTGNSARFFNNRQKAFVTAATCNTLLSTCDYQLTEVFSLLKA